MKWYDHAQILNEHATSPWTYLRLKLIWYEHLNFGKNIKVSLKMNNNIPTMSHVPAINSKFMPY